MPADNRLTTASEDLVILVHGTFAARDADEGTDWWQTGSETWKQMSQRLPRGVRLPQHGEVFHWPGDNSERARIKAAGDLLTRLRDLESQGRHYHLVGHSHGGSLIWQALRLATMERQPLEHLRSWATVGTPFLHHRTRGAWSFVNLVNILLALVLFKPAYATLRKLVQTMLGPLVGIDGAGTVVAEHVPRKITLFRTPVLWVAEHLGITVATLQDGIRIGSFDSSRGDSFYQFLFCDPEGWLLIGISLLVIYVYLNLGAFFLSPVLESLRIRKEESLERKVLQTYRGRWLGIWSPDDEAINGLRATLDLSISFVARMAPHERVWLSDYFALVSRPYYWVLAPLFNTFLRPLLDGMVRSFVIKTAQGNNRPAAEVVAVSPVPAHTESADQYPSLPAWLNRELVQTANRHARDIAPKLRQLLAEPSFISGLETFGQTMSGRELVHTSYFDHAEILDLLVLHILWATGAATELAGRWSGNEELLVWLSEFKERVGVELPRGSTSLLREDAPQRELIRPRRRVGLAHSVGIQRQGRYVP